VPTTDDIDTDRLPAAQYLILETLAARHRLGEQWWTFPTRLRRQLRGLEELGWVSLMSSQSPGTVRARLTDDGLRSALGPNFVSPVDRALIQAAEDIIELTEGLRVRFGDQDPARRGRLGGLAEAASMLRERVGS
jgi:hypothetical protein